MKKYLIVAALVLFVPQPINAQADGFYLMVDNTTKECRIMPAASYLPPRRLDIRSWASTPRWMRPKRL
jgi:hypothetical protein